MGREQEMWFESSWLWSRLDGLIGLLFLVFFWPQLFNWSLTNLIVLFITCTCFVDYSSWQKSLKKKYSKTQSRSQNSFLYCYRIQGCVLNDYLPWSCYHEPWSAVVLFKHNQLATMVLILASWRDVEQCPEGTEVLCSSLMFDQTDLPVAYFANVLTMFMCVFLRFLSKKNGSKKWKMTCFFDKDFLRLCQWA